MYKDMDEKTVERGGYGVDREGGGKDGEGVKEETCKVGEGNKSRRGKGDPGEVKIAKQRQELGGCKKGGKGGEIEKKVENGSYPKWKMGRRWETELRRKEEI